MLSKDLFNDDFPVLEKAFSTDLMGSHIVRSEALHAEIVDEPVLFHIDDIGFDLSIGYLFWNESESDRESVSLK